MSDYTAEIQVLEERRDQISEKIEPIIQQFAKTQPDIIEQYTEGYLTGKELCYALRYAATPEDDRKVGLLALLLLESAEAFIAIKQYEAMAAKAIIRQQLKRF